MRVHDLLQIAGLPTLVFVGLGAGVAAANFGGAELVIPVELSIGTSLPGRQHSYPGPVA